MQENGFNDVLVEQSATNRLYPNGCRVGPAAQAPSGSQLYKQRAAEELTAGQQCCYFDYLPSRGLKLDTNCCCF